MKKIGLLFLLNTFLALACISQNNIVENSLLNKLDSISRSRSISKYFAGLYYYTTLAALDFFSNTDEKVQLFMQRLEIRFGNYFFDASNYYQASSEQSEAWNAYYKDSTLSPAQYFLLGANAHINGDLWQALTKEFSLQEIQDNRKPYFSFYKRLIKVYSNVYEEVNTTSKKLRWLHGLSLGFDKVYGKLMLYRWRRRQMQLALLYFTNPGRLERKIRKVKRKMIKMDSMIRKLL